MAEAKRQAPADGVAASVTEVCTILLVEDLEDDVILFRFAIKNLRAYRIVWRSHDGDDAIAYLSGAGRYADRQAYPFPDIMVLDLKMPNCNGFEVLEWLRDKVPRPVVGIFSSSDELRDRKRASELGADLFQVKTHEPAEFQGFLQRLQLLATRRARDVAAVLREARALRVERADLLAAERFSEHQKSWALRSDVRKAIDELSRSMEDAKAQLKSPTAGDDPPKTACA